MTEKPKKTPKEELECFKKYIYDTGIIFECKENSRVQILGEDVVDLLNELTTKCSKLEKENEQLQTKNNAYLQDIEVFKEENTTLKLENEWLKEENQELHKLNQEYIDSLSDEKKETLSEMLNAILGDDGE